MSVLSVKLHPFKIGHCRHLEWCSDRGGRLSAVCFPAHCALIEHPSRGWILYDTGYSPEFFDATKQFPERLYRMMLPVTLEDSERIEVQLSRLGLSPSDVSICIVSHFHADHVAGLKLFANAQFIAAAADLARIKLVGGSRWRGVLEGYLSQLLPRDFFSRVSAAEDSSSFDLPLWMRPFATAYDLFGDGSVLGVILPGHSPGQLGVLLPDVDGRPVFLAADACWSAPACAAGRLPGWPGMMISASRKNFVTSFRSLSSLMVREPSILVLPSHCRSSWSSLDKVR